MATNNDLLSDIAETDRNTKTNNQLLQMIADGGGSGGGQVNSIVAGDNITVDDSDPVNPIVSATGGGGGGLSSPLAEDTDFNMDNHLMKFATTNGAGSFEAEVAAGGGINNLKVYSSAIALRTGGENGGEGTEYKGSVIIQPQSISLNVPGGFLGIDGDGQSLITIAFENISFQSFPSSRDDTNIAPPENFLYTDSSGNLLSAPLVSSGTTGERPEEGVTGQQYFDTTLGLPIWLSATPGSWVDATGTSV